MSGVSRTPAGTRPSRTPISSPEPRRPTAPTSAKSGWRSRAGITARPTDPVAPLKTTRIGGTPVLPRARKPHTPSAPPLYACAERAAGTRSARLSGVPARCCLAACGAASAFVCESWHRRSPRADECCYAQRRQWPVPSDPRLAGRQEHHARAVWPGREQASRREERRMANVAVGQKTAESRHRALGLTDEQALEIYRLLVLARKTSERMLTLSMQGKVAIAIPSDGHEAAQIGSMLAMRPDDIIYPYYRSIPGVLARGMSVREVVLDYLARADGPSSGGRQMPGHWARPDLKLITGSSSVGTQIPHAVGSALASKIRGEDTVTIVYFGDGATSKGDFHEGLNFAGIHQLPVIFFCENNRYAISVPFSKQSAVKSAADRAQGYNMPGVSFDGMDVLETYRI